MSWARCSVVLFVLLASQGAAAADGPASTYTPKPLVVTTILEPPYTMRVANHGDQELVGNDRYEGYIVDLVDKLSELLGFNYTLQLVADGRYGAPEIDGNWNGMIREVMDRKADMTAAALTVSFLREQVVDFSHPFMMVGTGVLLKRPRREESFPGIAPLTMLLAPFSFDVWLVIIFCFIVVSLLLFVFTRFLPSAKSVATEEELRKERAGQTLPSCLDSFWWTCRSLALQGWTASRSPTSIAVRILAAFWSVFALLSIILYLVALNNSFPAYSGVERPARQVMSLADLASQTNIKYGTVYGGSTMTFFKSSKIPTYSRMWEHMSSSTPSAFVNSTTQGIDRVKKGGYAYIGESTTLDYVIRRHCDLETLGMNIDMRGYGLAFPMGSPYKGVMNTAILQLRETGTLDMLYNKWWGNSGTCANRDKDGQEEVSRGQPVRYFMSLDLAMFSGPLVFLVLGVVLALLAAAVELILARVRGTGDSGGKNPSSSDEEQVKL